MTAAKINKSAFDLDFIVIGVVIFSLSAVMTIQIVKHGFSIMYLALLTPFLISLFFHLQSFIKSTKIWYTSKQDKVVVFKNYFTKKVKTYNFNELDGYVTGRFPIYGPNGPKHFIKMTWIVKNNKMIERIDERYIFNFNELEEELKAMKYLGYQKIRLWKRFKMLLGPISIN